MASVTKRPNGHKWIQFVDSDQKRKTIRLGKCSLKDARSIATKVETILNARARKLPMDLELCNWLSEITDDFHGKLAAVGLVPKRESTQLKIFMDSYLETRGDLKPITIGKYKVVCKKLIDFFGADKPINKINAGDAEDFRRFVARGEGVNSENTVSKAIQHCKTMFGYAERKELIRKNPFAGQASNTVPKSDRMYFVTLEEAKAVLNECPSIEWSLLFVLARFGGMRCPSEPRELKWTDVDWVAKRITVRSPKNKRHNNGVRVLPLFPELEKYLRLAKAEAPECSEYVLPKLRNRKYNPATHMSRIVKKACGACWLKVFQNCRSTRQTELDQEYPSHVVTSWLGNSTKVAEQYYLQVTGDHFDKAVKTDKLVGKFKTDQNQDPKQKAKQHRTVSM